MYLVSVRKRKYRPLMMQLEGHWCQGENHFYESLYKLRAIDNDDFSSVVQITVCLNIKLVAP